MSSPQRIRVGAWLSANHWFAQELGHGEPNPFVAGLDAVARYNQERERLTYERLGDVGLGSADPQPWFSVPQHDGRIICATAYGAPYPAWDELSGSFWLDKSAHVWSGISTVAEVEKIPIPRWEDNALVQENARMWEEVRRKVGEERAREMSLNWTEYAWTHPRTGQSCRMSVFASFLDLGGFLMGSTEFMTTLAADHELSRALMHKCFEISASLSDFMCALYGRPRAGWCSMGGDNSCLVSADMYREYAMEFDRLVREKCGNVPRNLHSCGASRHLYEVWAEYPEKEQIVVMQTRAIPGAMAPLRRSLPHTYIELTIHQPQVNFERESPDRVRALVRGFAEALGFRDTSIGVIFSTIDDRCKANIAALFDAGREVNAMEDRPSGRRPGMGSGHTRTTLTRNLRDLGVEAGDILFIHSSFKSLGPVDGGAGTVVAALEDAVGADGLVLMPSFNLVENEKRTGTWNIQTSPATTGWLTEFFRQMPGTFRSDHYSHSVAARGRGAREFVADHLGREGLESPWDREPWGRTYGTQSPMFRAYEADGRIMMIGVDYHSSTYVHLVEVMYWHRCRARDPNAPYSWLRRPELGAFWDRQGRLRRGKVGDADCRLFHIKDYVDTLVLEVEANPGTYIK